MTGRVCMRGECDVVLTRTRYPNGRIETPKEFRKRKYCGGVCARKDQTNFTRATGPVKRLRRTGDRMWLPEYEKHVEPLYPLDRVDLDWEPSTADPIVKDVRRDEIERLG